MKQYIIFLFTLIFPALIFAQRSQPVNEHKCGRRPAEHKIELRSHKQSALMDKYDVHFYFLDIAMENNTTYVSGNVNIVSAVIASQLDTFAVELIDDLTVDSVLINSTEKPFIHNNDHIFVPLGAPLAHGAIFSAVIYYHGDPQVGGNFFSGISTDHSFSWGNSVTWTLSEPFNAYQWWPCKQSLTDKADSCWVFITTSNTNKAGSEGLLTAVTPLPGNKARYEWKSSYPIDYYLISASVAQYVDYSIYAYPAGTSDSVLIQNYVYDNPATLPYFQTDIDEVADFIELYSDLMGLYPFIKEKYGHCMAPISGGMEHQTMTTLGYFDFYLDCHELSHMWFGDNVTCATWSDIWINEGFASYGEYLAADYLISHSEAQSHMLDVHGSVMMQADGSVYVPPVQTGDENRIFDGRLSYDKGSAIIHMIRFEMQNDSLFFAALRKFQQDFRDSTATGLDFKNTVENLSGLNFTDFFNEWYFGEGFPTYYINWHQDNNVLYFTATQSTSTSITPLFKMLMEYKVQCTGGDTLIRVYQTANTNTFSVPISKHVNGMVVDPDNWVVDGPATVIMSVDDIESPDFFSLSPNPCKDRLIIEFPNPSALPRQISILDMEGRVLKAERVGERAIISTGSLAPGFYMLQAEGSGGKVVKRFMKY